MKQAISVYTGHDTTQATGETRLTLTPVLLCVLILIRTSDGLGHPMKSMSYRFWQNFFFFFSSNFFFLFSLFYFLNYLKIVQDILLGFFAFILDPKAPDFCKNILVGRHLGMMTTMRLFSWQML